MLGMNEERERTGAAEANELSERDEVTGYPHVRVVAGCHRASVDAKAGNGQYPEHGCREQRRDQSRCDEDGVRVFASEGCQPVWRLSDIAHGAGLWS